jgi:tripartite-type tricarboxylate transporter receptor subunit TctC
VINAPELREKFSAAATEVVGGTPDQLRAAVAEDMSKLERVIKAAGMRAP